MKAEHARKLGRLFVGGPEAWEAFKGAATPALRRAALDKIVKDNEPFIAACIRDLKTHGLSSPMSAVVDLADDDLMNAGRRGYAEALERFDPEKGALPKYAKDWIRSKVTRTAAKDSTIHIPEQVRIPAASIRAAEAIEAMTGREATAEEMGLTPARLAAWRSQPTVCAMDQVTGGRVPSEEPNAEDLLALKELGACVDALAPKHRQMMRHLYWDEMSLEEAADEMEITPDQAADLRDEALQELRAFVS
jgi:RNA polymerase sigma factor (sigma-70 family)